MERVLNTHTDTLHRPRDDRSPKQTECGALAHVAPEHVQRGPEGSTRSMEGVTRCGRCFRGEGGY